MVVQSETKRYERGVTAMRHKGTGRLETERLLLRPFRETDGDAMFRNWAGDPAVTKYLTWPPHQSAEESRAIAARWERESRDPAVYQWAVVLRELVEPIGSLSVVRMDEAAEALELGYCIGRAWWGRGYMTEAVRAAIGYLFRSVGANRVAACHDVRNPASGRVMEKAGMTREGTLRAAQRNNQGIVDVTYYSILAGEYNPGT